MMLEYYFPNEAAEPLLWHPVLFAYTLLVSGADLLILAALAYLSGSLRRAIPLMTMLGIAFFAVVLAGPLADLRSPQRAYFIFANPHIVPTSTNPGISLIAFQSIAWLIALTLSALFALFTFSYYSHQASLSSTGFKRSLYRFFSLGVTTAEKYGTLEKIAKVIAVLMLPFLVLWGIYPSSMFLMQTWNPAWRSWALLPVTYFADTFVVATALFMLVYFFWRYRALEREVVVPVLKIHAAGSISVAALTALQMAVWWFWSPSTAEMVTPITPLMYVVITLLMLSFSLSFIAIRYHAAILAVSLVAMAGTFTNKWNIIVSAQLISKTGLAFLEAELEASWILETISPVALGVVVFVILSLLFPLEVSEGGK